MRFWMPPFTTGKEKDILENLLKLMENVHMSVVSLDKAVKAFSEGNWKVLGRELENCSEYEQEADDIRRLMQRQLYTEGFLPFSREDYFNLSEAIDNIADQAEKASFWMSFRRIKLQKGMGSQLVDLSKKSLRTVERLKYIIDHIGPESKNIIAATQAVENERELAREVAKNLGKEIFSKDCTESYMLWELVYRIMSVADTAEEASDRMITITIKLVE
jgi:predicted phosphate transport protein (TIGR00153 family)